MSPLVIATWNLKHAVVRSPTKRADAWTYLANVVAPDIALVQEAGGPSGALDERRLEVHPGWGTGVVSFRSALEPFPEFIHPTWDRQASFRIPDAARDGTLAVALLPLKDGVPLVAISLYGQLAYADQSVIRAISDVLPVFDTPFRHRVVLGGDLNIHTHSNNPAERRRAKPILALIESLGMVDLVRESKVRGRFTQGDIADAQACPCDDVECYHVRTHKHPRHRKGEMANNDYLFGTEWLADRLTALVAQNGDADAAWSHSDHAPLVATFSV